MNKKIVALLGSCIITSVFAATVLSPNSNNQSGNIPSGHTELEFQLSNGNWVQNLYLPKTANYNDIIRISSTAIYPAYLDTTNTNLPIESLKLNNGSNYTFAYSVAEQKWLIKTDVVMPTNEQADFVVPTSKQIVQQVVVQDGAWAKQISLPNQANDGSLLQIISTAGYNSTINTKNLLFPSSYTLKKGDDFWFKYNAELQKWVPEVIKPYILDAGVIGKNINNINAPVTQINFGDGNWVDSIQLPVNAKDRDRVIFKSTATWAAVISNTNTNSQATLKLKNGDRYEFMYVADKSRWILVSAPELILQANDLTNKQIPNMEQPTTRIQSGNANWQPSLNLPISAKIGDKVILSSTADWNTTITAASGLSQTLKKDETQRYVYSAQGWISDSSTIDILLVSSTEASAKLGATAAKLRIYEGVNLTNSAAENSQAQFYIRPVGFLNYTVPTPNHALGDITNLGRDDKVIQNERNRLLADAVYYEGTEEGCGLAWLNTTPLSYNMIGTGSLNCGTTVMRHEFGHNLGLSHGDTTALARGFTHPLGSTIMGGNAIAYYANPNSYHPKYGVRLGEEGKIDTLGMINKNAPIVAKFK